MVRGGRRRRKGDSEMVRSLAQEGKYETRERTGRVGGGGEGAWMGEASTQLKKSFGPGYT